MLTDVGNMVSNLGRFAVLENMYIKRDLAYVWSRGIRVCYMAAIDLTLAPAFALQFDGSFIWLSLVLFMSA